MLLVILVVVALVVLAVYVGTVFYGRYLWLDTLLMIIATSACVVVFGILATTIISRNEAPNLFVWLPANKAVVLALLTWLPFLALKLGRKLGPLVDGLNQAKNL